MGNSEITVRNKDKLMPSCIVRLNLPFNEKAGQENQSDSTRVDNFCRDHLHIPSSSIEWRAVTKNINSSGDNEWQLADEMDKNNSYFIYIEKQDAKRFFELDDGDCLLISDVIQHFKKYLDSLYGLYGTQKTNSDQDADYKSLTNRFDLTDSNISERLYAHGLKAVFNEHTRDPNRRYIGQLQSVLVGVDTAFSESDNEKLDIDKIRVQRHFNSKSTNPQSIESIFWFPVHEKFDRNGEVTFTLVIGADGSNHDIHYTEPYFIYVEKEKVFDYYKIETVSGEPRSLNITQRKDLINLLVGELDSLSERRNERRYSLEVMPQNGWRVGHIHMESVRAHLTDNKDEFIQEVHDRITMIIDKIDNPVNNTVQVKMGFDVEYVERKGMSPLSILSKHVRQTFKTVLLVGDSYLDLDNNLVVNVNLDVIPAFRNLLNNQGDTLYLLMQEYIEQSIEANSDVADLRWDFAETMLTSNFYHDWSPVLLKALFACLVHTSSFFNVISADYLSKNTSCIEKK